MFTFRVPPEAVTMQLQWTSLAGRCASRATREKEKAGRCGPAFDYRILA